MEVKRIEENGNEKEKAELINGRNNDDAEKKVDDKNDDNEGVPVDTGWAWVIAFCVFANSTIIIGFNRSLSVLFLDISREFDQSKTITSLMFTVYAFTNSVASIIITNTVMNRYSVRTVCTVAAVANTIFTILISRAPNIIVFLLLFVLKGSSFAALLVGPISLIGFYFKNRRSLANSLATSGFCVAYIVFPPLTEFLRSEFGLRGCLLIISAIELHSVALSMLLRPVDSYKKAYARKKQKEMATMALEMVAIESKPSAIGKHINSGVTIEVMDVSKHDGDTQENDRLIAVGISEYDRNKTPVEGIRFDKDMQKNNRKITPRNTDDETLTRNGLISKEINSNLSYTVDEDGTSNFRQRSKSDAASGTKKDLPNDSTLIHDDTSLPQGSPPQFSSLRDLRSFITTRNHDNEPSGTVTNRATGSEFWTSRLSVMGDLNQPYVPPGWDSPGDEKDSNVGDKKLSCCRRVMTKVIDLSVFKFRRFRMFAVFISVAVFSNYLVIYMPTIGATAGLSKPDSALLMTISGVMDLASRVGTGFLGDFKFVSISKLIVFSLAVIGTICHCSRFFTTHTLFIVFAVLVGTFGGTRQNFGNVMLLDYVGAENMAKAFGLVAMLSTLSLSINHPIIGAMLDATGGFVVPLHYVGVMLYIAGFILLWEPVFKRLDDKRKATEEANEIKKVEKV